MQLIMKSIRLVWVTETSRSVKAAVQLSHEVIALQLAGEAIVLPNLGYVE